MCRGQIKRGAPAEEPDGALAGESLEWQFEV